MRESNNIYSSFYVSICFLMPPEKLYFPTKQAQTLHTHPSFKRSTHGKLSRGRFPNPITTIQG